MRRRPRRRSARPPRAARAAPACASARCRSGRSSGSTCATPSVTAVSRSASSRITFGDLPPSSSATALDGLRGQLADAPARRAVEPVNETMSTPGCAAIASPTTGPVPGDEVEHAGRQADLVDDLGEDERVQRRDLARLEHHRAAGGQRRRDLRGDLVQRVVPRRDRADDADRLAHDQRVADLLLATRRPRAGRASR